MASYLLDGSTLSEMLGWLPSKRLVLNLCGIPSTKQRMDDKTTLTASSLTKLPEALTVVLKELGEPSGSVGNQPDPASWRRFRLDY